METIQLILFAILVLRWTNAQFFPKNRAKIVENYVLSAKFDTKTNLPQLKIGHAPQRTNEKSNGKKNKSVFAERKEGTPGISSHDYQSREVISDDYFNSHALNEGSLVVNHHHIGGPPPPPPPPVVPPPPPPIIPVNFGPQFLALGFICFLMLLNALQTSLMQLMRPNTLLGSLTNPLGRRKRFAENKFITRNFQNFNRRWRDKHKLYGF